MTRVYVNVNYDKKEIAKKHGFSYDPKRKLWYIDMPVGADVETVRKIAETAYEMNVMFTDMLTHPVSDAELLEMENMLDYNEACAKCFPRNYNRIQHERLTFIDERCPHCKSHRIIPISVHATGGEWVTASMRICVATSNGYEYVQVQPRFCTECGSMFMGKSIINKVNELLDK